MRKFLNFNLFMAEMYTNSWTSFVYLDYGDFQILKTVCTFALLNTTT